jgi:dTMP kinase
LFISLEGIDGSGKTTQAALLADALGEDTVRVREPGGTEAAEHVRKLLADPDVDLDPLAELLLFLAARADLASTVIAPALAAGRHVVADRFADSSAAYQGGARGLGIEKVEQLSDAATEGLRPGLTILLRVEVDTATGRVEGEDRFEAQGAGFQRAVAEAYETLAERHPERIVVVDGEGPPEAVHERVLSALARARPRESR